MKQVFQASLSVLPGLALLAASASAQAPLDGLSPTGLPTFGTTVETVALNVTVTTGKQGYVGNLTRDDFLVYEDGVPQRVTIFGNADVPLDVVVLLDLSASLRDRIGFVRSAAKGFLRTLRPGDRGAVIGFNQSVRVLANWTEDRPSLEAAIDQTRASGGTALYSAIYIALKGLGVHRIGEADTLRRRVVVVLSDGDDTSSLVSYDDVLETCRRSGVMVYTIAIKRVVPPELERLLKRQREVDGEYVLRSLARETGARPFTVVQLEQLPRVYADISQELAHQYLLGYVPSAVEGPRTFHLLSVAVPGRVNAQARTRVGYLRSPTAPALAGARSAGEFR
jgi:Ca-activated chloride channel family protein